MKKNIKILGTIGAAITTLLFLVACGTAKIESPNTISLETQALENTLANPVPLPDGSLYPYPTSYPVEDDSETKLAKRAKQFLKDEAYRDPSFDDSSNPAWSCNESSSISDGILNLGLNDFSWSTIPVGFCTQEINTYEAGTYYLTCKGSVDILNGYSVFGLVYTDSEEKEIATDQTLSHIRKQNRITVDIPEGIKSLNIRLYTETPASYDYCYLSNKTQPKLVTETIYDPVKPLELLVPLYIDPDIVINNADGKSEVVALESWKNLIQQARHNPNVPMTVILDPSSAPKEGNGLTLETAQFCEYGGFVTPVERTLDDKKTIKINNVLRSLQKTGVDTIGYVPTGFGKTDAETIKSFIDKIADKCPYLDGIFFDEAELDENTLDNYNAVCNYARSKFPNGKFVLNAGLNFSVELDSHNCNIAVPYEQTPQGNPDVPGSSWEDDYAAYGFDGSVGQPATAVLIHSNMTNRELRKNVDLAYSRKFDYIYITNLTLNEAIFQNNPWFALGSNWNKLVSYISRNNKNSSKKRW